ncbi:FCD domain-containing protein [Aeromicrobium sp. Leaf350]|uniref:FCD domain-containing protein n=1 Tax=Aeromicrobium sp. Leaf350 TaxID=2876565 RepID=UPI001E3DB6D5|nr:FCD domain-containing protein [Aeromicrobium sp. Leaf350]
MNTKLTASEERNLARILDARCALSLGVVDMVVPNLRDEQVAKLRTVAEAAVPSPATTDGVMDLSELTDTVVPFNEVLIGLAENHLLLDMLRSLKISAAFRQLLPDVGDVDLHAAWSEGRLRIVESLEARDRDAAAEAVRAYHADVKRRFFDRHSARADDGPSAP